MKSRFKIVAAMAASIAPLLAAETAAAQQMITIYLDGRHIVSMDSFTFEIYDRVCNRSAGTVTIRGGEQNRAAVQVCAGGTGKGSITYRNVTLNGPTIGADFLAPGEAVHP